MSSVVGELLIIFGLEALFVTVMTCRWIILVRGSRYIAAAASFFEQMLNVLALGLVVTQLHDPMRFLAFGLGYAVGSLAGSWLEGKLAFGYSMYQVVAKPGSRLADKLREAGVGVTEWPVAGGEGERRLVMAVVRRRWSADTVRIIEREEPGAFIIQLDPQAYKNGFVQKRRIGGGIAWQEAKRG
ncbi:DUF2179 domain-containing protein [Paenibacillus humicola]|uniref:DUF2179 domain-containing protein n=1 Tax=Paenibacillus humicola TaxID=3110540 RepID=UPI00237C1600|nr:DUF5698 domain-containing protein [Paenibacillus humicola]